VNENFLLPLLFNDAVNIETMEQLMAKELARETQVLRGNFHRCHFVQHKSHMICPGIEPGPPYGLNKKCGAIFSYYYF
jgi:hypothetical protein